MPMATEFTDSDFDALMQDTRRNMALLTIRPGAGLAPLNEAQQRRGKKAAMYARTTAPGDVVVPIRPHVHGALVALQHEEPRETQPGRFDEMACWGDDEKGRAEAAARSLKHSRRWGMWLALLGVPALVAAIGLGFAFWRG